LGLLGSTVLACQHNYFSMALCGAVIGIGYGAVWPLYAAPVKDAYGWDHGLHNWPMGYKPAYMVGFATALVSTALIAILDFKHGKRFRV